MILLSHYGMLESNVLAWYGISQTLEISEAGINVISLQIRHQG